MPAQAMQPASIVQIAQETFDIAAVLHEEVMVLAAAARQLLPRILAVQAGARAGS